MHACMHACMHAYIHTYIHTHIHTCTDVNICEHDDRREEPHGVSVRQHGWDRLLKDVDEVAHHVCVPGKPSIKTVYPARALAICSPVRRPRQKR